MLVAIVNTALLHEALLMYDMHRTVSDCKYCVCGFACGAPASPWQVPVQ